MEYTKGKWAITNKAGHLEVICPSGTGNSHYVIAQVPNITNARLIASAPDLYEACQHTLIWLSALIASSPHLESGKKLAEIINKALAKAEGKDA